MKSLKLMAWALLLLLLAGGPLLASEADLAIPDLRAGTFFNGAISAWGLLFGGALVICGTLGISLYLRAQIYALPAHKSMLDVAEIIFQTCKTYLIQQGKFLLGLFVLIACAMAYYLLFEHGGEVEQPKPEAAHINKYVTFLLVMFFAIVGMGGSYWVAWYGIRVNTYANCRTAFAALKGEPWDVVNIPLRAGMSIGLFLISLELIMMVIILLFVPREVVGICFLGFAIGESLG